MVSPTGSIVAAYKEFASTKAIAITLNPSNAEAYFDAKIFENHLNPVTQYTQMSTHLPWFQ